MRGFSALRPVLEDARQRCDQAAGLRPYRFEPHLYLGTIELLLSGDPDLDVLLEEPTPPLIPQGRRVGVPTAERRELCVQVARLSDGRVTPPGTIYRDPGSVGQAEIEGLKQRLLAELRR